MLRIRPSPPGTPKSVRKAKVCSKEGTEAKAEKAERFVCFWIQEIREEKELKRL